MQLLINGIPTEKSEDIITKTCNMLRSLERYGHVNVEDIRSFAKELLQGNIPADNSVYPAIEMHKKMLDVFVKHLAKTLRPLLFGISRGWRKTQEEALRSNIKAFERGYTRLLSEIPTGAGKSMIIGAIVRAALNTMKELDLDQEIHIVTSRIAIAGQLIYEKLPEEQKEDVPLDMGKKGDVRMWCPELGDEKIRVLAGTKGQNLNEQMKNSVLTVSTYQGLTAKRVNERFKKTPFIIIFDESHHVTERVATLADQFKCLTVGMSATVLGPERDPFFFFERIERPELMKLVNNKKTSYIDFLAYHKSIAEMIKDQELKPIRWFNSRLKINISEALVKTSSKGPFDVFNESSVSKILAKNPELIAKVVEEAYTEEHLGLTLAGSKQVRERRGVAFVDRVETAKIVSGLVNKSIPPKLRELFGESTYFKAGYVDGTMSQKEYEATIAKFESGEITLLFSVKKIGEGVDLPFVDMVLFLRPFGLGSMWELVQALGRGTRLDIQSLLADLLVLDMVFISDRHLLSSVIGIFGRSTSISGGLISGWGNSYEIESKIFGLLKKGRSWKEVWEALSEEERATFPVIKGKVIEEQNRGKYYDHQTRGLNTSNFSIEEIQFVEQEDVRLGVSLGNHEEMMRYIIDVLKQEGFKTIDQIRSIQASSLLMFQRRRFQTFRDGLTMVNLALGEKKSQLTSGSLTDFISLLRKYGMEERVFTSSIKEVVEPIPGKKSDVVLKKGRVIVSSNIKKRFTNTIVAERKDLSTTESFTDFLSEMRYLFGIEPEITSNVRDQYDRETVYINQATISLPEGLKFSSVIWRNKNQEHGINQAAAELHKVVKDQIKNNTVGLYYNSQWFNYHIKMVYVFIKDREFSSPFFTTTQRDGIYTTMASIEKFGWKINGNPVVGVNEEHVKKHALVRLARELSKTFPVDYGTAHLVEPKNVYRTKLEAICQSLKAVYKKSYEVIKIEGVDISKTRISCNGIKIECFGVNTNQSVEKAAKEMFLALIEQSGGSAFN